MRRSLGWSSAWLAVGLVAVVSCTAPQKGALMLAVSTDLQVPKDIDVLSVYVATSGKTKFDFLGRMAPQGSVEMPATLAIVQPDDPGAEVRIRVIGFEEQDARVLRDVITTVPKSGTSLLRVPLDYLDLGSAKGMIPANLLPGGAGGAPDGDTTFDPNTIMSTCDIKQGLTSINGKCASANVSSGDLPAYDPVQVFGEAGAQSTTGVTAGCFDVATCLRGATSVATSLASAATTCTFSLPSSASPSSMNLALVTSGDGVCVATGKCLVPLIEDPALGWTVSGTTVSLPVAVCTQVASGVDLVMTTGTCATVVASQPICQPATADGGGAPLEATTMADAAAEAGVDAGLDATPDASAASSDAPVDAPGDATIDATVDAPDDGNTTDSAADATTDTAADDGGSLDALDAPCDAPMCACAAADACSGSVVFSYTGSAQTFDVPLWVTQVTVVAQGAGGGADGCFNTSAGGTTTATISVTPGETLTVMVGGAGGTGSSGGLSGVGGFNGGAAGGTNSYFTGGVWGGGGGGGASDVRQGGASLADRVVVAGGGGGAAGGTGGAGGGATGATGGSCGVTCSTAGGGGTSTAGGVAGTGNGGDGGAGALGVGAIGGDGNNCNCAAGGGGGGGYYGGGGGGGFAVGSCGPEGGSGGGGSSYAVATATNVSMTQGDWNSNGQVTISY